MIWTDKISNLKTCKIQSTLQKGLTEEFIILFSEINGIELSNNQEIIIYINATNGNLFISAFDFETKEVFDETAIFVELTEFWEENQNAYDFDEIIILSLKKAFKMSNDIQFKSNYKVFYQTEEENDAKRL